QLADARLNTARNDLRKLVLVGRDEELSDVQREAAAADLIGRLWAAVVRGRAYLDNRLSEGESQAEADAVLEDVLGKIWKLDELKAKGYTKPDLHLFELAWERIDDDARQERIETSYLLELGDGTVYEGITYRPYKGMQFVPEQESYPRPLRIAQVGVYPGFTNRRVRWDKGSEKPEDLT